MLGTFTTGETMRISAKDLTHKTSGPVTAGATVTVEIYNPDGTINTTTTAAPEGGGDDWSVDVDAPSVPGEYTIKIFATMSGAKWKEKNTIRVIPF